MRHKFIATFLICVSFLISACPTDLPPSPDGATFSSPVGKATEAFEGYAVPTTFTIDPDYIEFETGDSSKEVDASVSGDQYVYKYGYVYDSGNAEWVRFQFSQSTVGLSNWILGDATRLLSISKEYVADQTLFDVNQPIYVIAYACTKESGVWNCHENKWMLNTVNARLVTVAGGLPPEPTIPGVSSIQQCTQTDGSIAVCFWTKLNEPLGSLNYGYIWEQNSPTYLAAGKYIESEGDNKNNVNYIQFINLTESNYPAVVHAQDDDLAPIEGDYLYFKRSNLLWSYNLYFYDAVRFDTSNSSKAKEDFAGTTITLLGNVYIITDVSLSTTGALDSITLLEGEAVLWLTEGQPVIPVSVNHRIEVLDVTVAADACQIKVDDTTAIIDVGETKTVNGVNVGVIDARNIISPLNNTDECQLALGAKEIKIDASQTDGVRVDDVDIEGSKAILTGGPGSWTGLTISLTPKGDTLKDDLYLSPGGQFADPIFGVINYNYLGPTQSGLFATEMFVKIEETPEEPVPTADFSASAYAVVVGTSVDFTDLSTSPVDMLINHTWDFGDGTVYSLFAIQPTYDVSHTFSAVGEFPVTLSIMDEDGSESSITRNITVVLGNQSPTLCTDSDNGLSYYQKGTVTLTGGTTATLEDVCGTGSNSRMLTEYYCGISEIYACPSGCSDGACVKAYTCVDSDPTSNLTTLGNISIINSTGGTEYTVSDMCPSPSATTALNDAYCKANGGTEISLLVGMNSLTCPTGTTCSNGVCAEP